MHSVTQRVRGALSRAARQLAPARLDDEQHAGVPPLQLLHLRACRAFGAASMHSAFGSPSAPLARRGAVSRPNRLPASSACPLACPCCILAATTHARTIACTGLVAALASGMQLARATARLRSHGRELGRRRRGGGSLRPAPPPAAARRQLALEALVAGGRRRRAERPAAAAAAAPRVPRRVVRARRSRGAARVAGAPAAGRGSARSGAITCTLLVRAAVGAAVGVQVNLRRRGCFPARQPAAAAAAKERAAPADGAVGAAAAEAVWGLCGRARRAGAVGSLAVLGVNGHQAGAGRCRRVIRGRLVGRGTGGGGAAGPRRPRARRVGPGARALGRRLCRRRAGYLCRERGGRVGQRRRWCTP